MNAPKRQHFIPQFYLRRWANQKHRLNVLDKTNGRVFEASVKDIAHHKNFYNDPGEDHVIERRLSALESATAPVLNEIVDAESVEGLTPQERETLDLFLAVQMERTEDTRQRHGQMKRAMLHRFRDAAPSEFRAELEAYDPVEAHREVIQEAGFFVPSIQKLALSLIVNDTPKPLTTSDHPIHRVNRFPPDMPGLGNLGLESKGIEIHFPVSPRAQLVWLDTRVWPGGRYPVCIPVTDPEHLRIQRSYQVFSSHRFIYSTKADFDIEKEILARRPEAADPDRPRLAMPHGGDDLIRASKVGASEQRQE